jgi:DinB superfamily
VQKLKWITILALWFAAASLLAEAAPQVTDTKVVDARNAASLDAQKEKRAFESLLNLVEKEIISTVDAMPADKFGFAPTDGEFKGVRTFGQMVKHFSATNHILAAAALGEEPPAEAGDELGPETVRTKAEILAYLKGSFVHLDKAVEAIGQTNIPVNASPISPLKRGEVTRLALITETLLHAYDHSGQLVEYLRMNGVVPPASRP